MLGYCIYTLCINVHILVRTGVEFGINFMSCSENGNVAIIATMSGIYPKLMS